MQDQNRHGSDSEYSSAEGLSLALNYLSDPGDVPCPTCGPGTIEVVAYLDADGIEEGVVRASSPEGDYTVVLYCHDCKRAAALDLSPDNVPEDFRTDEGDERRNRSSDDRTPGDNSDDRWAA